MSTTKMKKSSLKQSNQQRTRNTVTMQRNHVTDTANNVTTVRTPGTVSRRRRNFTEVKSGLTEIKNNLTSNQNLMSQRHKELKQQKKLLSSSKSSLSKMQQSKSYIKTKDMHLKKQYAKVKARLDEIAKSSVRERDEISHFDNSVSVFKETIDNLNNFLEKCKDKNAEFRRDYDEKFQAYKNIANEERIEKLKSESKETEDEISNTNKIFQNRIKKITEIQTKLDALNTSNDEKKKTIQTLQNNICSLEDEIKSMKNEKEEHDRIISVQREKLSRKKQVNEDIAQNLKVEINGALENSSYAATTFDFSNLRITDNTTMKYLYECTETVRADYDKTWNKIHEFIDQNESLKQYDNDDVDNENDSNLSFLHDKLDKLEMDKSTIEKSADDLEQQNATILASCNDIETKTNDLDNQNMHKKNELKDVAVKLHDINDSNETNDFHKKVQLINTYGMANEDNVESKNGVEHRIATPLFDSLLKLKELRLKIENAEIIKSLQLRHDTSKSKYDETMIQYQWHITHDKAKQEEAAQVKAKREQERKEKEAQLIAKREEEARLIIKKEKEAELKAKRAKEREREERLISLKKEEEKRKKRVRIRIEDTSKVSYQADLGKPPVHSKHRKKSLDHHDVYQKKVASHDIEVDISSDDDSRRGRRKSRSGVRSRSRSRNRSRSRSRGRRSGRSTDDYHQSPSKSDARRKSNDVSSSKIASSSRNNKMFIKPDPITNNRGSSISNTNRKSVSLIPKPSSSSSRVSIIKRRKSKDKSRKDGDKQKKRRKFKSKSNVESVRNLWDTPL